MPASIMSRNRTVAASVGAVGFLGVYLAVSPISDALADRPLPLPDASAADTLAYVAANPAAVTASAVLQIVSVACFALFVASVAPLLRAGRNGARLPLVAWCSVAAMVVSSVLVGTAAAVASSGSVDTVAALREASFYAGGVANVGTLGAFVVGAALVLSWDALPGRATRVFGLVAGSLAMLSVLSLAIYYATPLLPVGRVLSMVWTVVIAVRLWRSLSTG